MQALLQHYALIKQAHIALVAASGLLFVARGIGVLLQARWPMAPLARRGSVLIDTLLLAAGVALWSVRGWHPGLDGWLHAKLALLLAYIVAGSIALKRGRTPQGRALAFAVALLLLAAIVGVALAHHPRGWLRFMT